MTDTNEKIRALFLSALMVLSVVAMTVSFAGMAAANHTDANNEGDDHLTSGNTYWQGQELYIEAGATGVASNETVRIRRVTDDGDIGGLVDQFQLTSGNATFDTSDLDGFYVIVNESGNVIEFDGDGVGAARTDAQESAQVTAGEFEVAPQTFSAEFDEDDVPVTSPDTATILLDSNRANYNVNISAEGLDEDDLVDIFGTTGDNDGSDGGATYQSSNDDDEVQLTVGSSEVIEANFSEFDDAGEYTFDIEVSDTTASASASVEVQEEDVNLNFANGVYNEHAGDVAAITVTLEDTSEGYLYVGGEDVNYLERVHFVDDDGDGQVTILMNTWRAGQGAANVAGGGGNAANDNSSAFGSAGDSDDNSFWTLGSGDDVIEGVKRYNDSDLSGTDITANLTSPLEAADYSLTLTAANEEGPNVNEDGNIVYEDEEDVATLDLTDGSVDSLQTMVAPSSHDVADLDDEELEELVADSTASDTVASGDLLVVQVEASGIYGYLPSDVPSGQQVGTLNAIGAFLEVTQTNSAGNRDPKEVDWTNTGSNAMIYPVASEDTFYLVMDTGNIDAFETGDEYEVEFRRGDEDLDDSPSPYVDDGEEESVSAEFSLDTADADFDNIADGDLQVAQDEEATVSGTTNVAPGTELNVRLRRTGDNPFLETQSVTVAEDGSLEATFDTSDIPVDTTFTATIRQGGNALSDETDGIIVDQLPDETETPTETETMTETETEAPETDTEAPETDTPEPGTETETEGQPGFGVAIAIVALLGAALLALRRRD